MDNWLDSYVEWAMKCSKGSKRMHRWCGYALMGSALGKSKLFDWGAQPIHAPLQMVFTVGEAQEALAEAVMAPARHLSHLHGLRSFSGHASKHQMLAEARRGAAVAFLPRRHTQRWMKGPMGKLVEDWSQSPEKYSMIGPRPSLSFTLDQARLTLIGIVSQDELKPETLLPTVVALPVEGGPDGPAWPTSPDQAQAQQLSQQLRQMASVSPGIFSLEGIRAEYETWAKEFARQSVSPRRLAQVQHMQQLCLKLALYEHWACSSEVTVSLTAFHKALSMVEGIAQFYDQLDEQSVQGPRLSPLWVAKVIEALMQATPIPLEELSRLVRMPRGKALDIATVLARQKVLRVERNESNRYILTWLGPHRKKAMSERSFWDDVPKPPRPEELPEELREKIYPGWTAKGKAPGKEKYTSKDVASAAPQQAGVPKSEEEKYTTPISPSAT